jgi:predicted nucleic acid-binding protein
VTVTLDINVFVDVFRDRQPYIIESLQVMEMIAQGRLTGVCPAHGLTTLYYLIRKHGSRRDAEGAMDRVLDHFQIGALDADGWRAARRLPMDDFEDAVVAMVAKSSGSGLIVTRDVEDFAGSPVPAISPADFLIKFPAKR